MVDEYRVKLFKKKLREIFNADWVRFYWSKDRSHLCLTDWHHGKENLILMRQDLKKAGIQFVEKHDSMGFASYFGRAPCLDGLSIPIDQEALPERKTSRGTRLQSRVVER